MSPRAYTQEEVDAAENMARMVRLVEHMHLAFRVLVAEAEYVVSGGDNPADKCGECGCAGVGMLRDAIADARKVLERV